MRYFLLVFFLMGHASLLLSQSILKGVVLEADSGQPIPFATVYFDGTTNGQTTDENGYFQLPLKDIELPAILVVSHVGYHALTLPVHQAEQALKLALRIQEQIISTVVVEDRNQRQKNLEEFRQLFVGGDEWGRKARILNEEAIVFSRDYVTEKLAIRNQYMRDLVLEADRPNLEWALDGKSVTFDQAVNLSATARVPLEIEMPDLGYTLRVDLKSFETVYKQGTTAYFGHFFFQAKEGANQRLKKRYEKNRERAYFNSSLHFLRALYAGALADNGYQLLEEINNESGKRKEVKPFDIAPYLEGVGDDQIKIAGLSGRKLIVLYYGDRKGRPLPASKWKKRQPVQSGLHFADQDCVIRADGTTGLSGLYFSGDLGNRGVAWLLPSDWVLESE